MERWLVLHERFVLEARIRCARDEVRAGAAALVAAIELAPAAFSPPSP
jgi:hypothetical protein